METVSALLVICAGNSPVPGEFPAQRPVTRSFDVFLICTRISGWINNGEPGDLRRYSAHYDVTIMDYECVVVYVYCSVRSCAIPWCASLHFVEPQWDWLGSGNERPHWPQPTEEQASLQSDYLPKYIPKVLPLLVPFCAHLNNGFVQDCSISTVDAIANAIEIPLSCSKSSKCFCMAMTVLYKSSDDKWGTTKS